MASKESKRTPDMGDKISFSNKIYNSYYADSPNASEKSKRPLFYRDLKKARREAEQLKVENELLSKHSINSSDFKPVSVKRSKAEENDLKKIKKILARELGKTTTIKEMSEGKTKVNETNNIEVLKGPRDQFTKNMPESARKEIARLIYREFKKAREEIAMLKMENKILKSKSLTSDPVKAQQKKGTPFMQVRESPLASPPARKKIGKQKVIKKADVLKASVPPMKRRAKKEVKKDLAIISAQEGRVSPRPKKHVEKSERHKVAEADLHSKFNVLMEIAKMGGAAGKEDLPKKLTEFKREFLKKM